MKNKQSYLTKGSFALLLFVILGYMVKFYPEQLVGFDSPIQTWLRGDLPAFLTTFFKLVTSLIDPLGIIIWVSALSLFFLYKKWKLEAVLLAGNLILHGILIKLIKLVYHRSRPSLSHLVEEDGYSFPLGTIIPNTYSASLSRVGRKIVWTGSHQPSEKPSYCQSPLAIYRRRRPGAGSFTWSSSSPRAS